MNKNNITNDLIAIGLGILGGIALAKLLKLLTQKQCPNCENQNESNRQLCKFCGNKL